MGSFEKLGILVIVVIIVMILAVAIYQWGGSQDIAATGEGAVALAGGAPALEVDYIDERKPAEPGGSAPPAPEPPPSGDLWPGGVPKLYKVQPQDRVWVLAVRRWQLKEEFVAAIAAANPRVDLKDLKPGTLLRIPDPSAYRSDGRTPERKAARGTVRYEVQVGDTLETIARNHLGAKKHWRLILETNPGLNPRRLMPGQEILLPVTTK